MLPGHHASGSALYGNSGPHFLGHQLILYPCLELQLTNAPFVNALDLHSSIIEGCSWVGPEGDGVHTTGRGGRSELKSEEIAPRR